MNQVQMAAKMYDARDAMKRLFGDKYQAEIAEHQKYIKIQMQSEGVGELKATMRIMTMLQAKLPNSGITQALVLAACVELIEPERKP